MSYKISMSYVITTRNKLPYLTEVMKRLLENVKEDEEIIVTDGASTDGTVEFLTELYKEGKIHKFISEPDKGEAHGYNKAILLAEGELIKIITDDDIFDYEAIGIAKKYMLNNTSVDMLTGYAATVNNTELQQLIPIEEFYSEFKKWQNRQQKTFYSNGLALIIRKNSLPILGLFNNSVIYVDIEYTIRNNFYANTVFSNLCYAVRINNEKSKSTIYQDFSKKQMYDICELYKYTIPKTWLPEIELKVNWKLKLKRKIRTLFNPPKKKLNNNIHPQKIEPSQLFLYYEEKINKYNCSIVPKFYMKND